MWLTCMTVSHPSTVSARLCSITPALRISTSNFGPTSMQYFLWNSRTESNEARSRGINLTSRPAGNCFFASCALVSDRQARITVAPCSASRRAVSNPMPVFAPVTTTVLPSMRLGVQDQPTSCFHPSQQITAPPAACTTTGICAKGNSAVQPAATGRYQASGCCNRVSLVNIRNEQITVATALTKQETRDTSSTTQLQLTVIQQSPTAARA
mmetsp:Transcript_16389/g.41880  ORF Transcript_16389/g.41880 Transcript_16389/m.41880 type:complete len:211 (+) Transcript_16389:579-1211(+)